MKKCLFLMSLLLVSTNIFADERPFITVLDFRANNIPEMEVVVFVDFLSSQIQKAGSYRVIDRMQRENILTELNFSNSGCTDESCQLEIGKLLQAKQMIVGSMGAVGDSQILNIKLIEVETGETINSASKQYKSINEMLAGSSQLINELLNIQSDEKILLEETLIEQDSSMVEKEEYISLNEEKSIEAKVYTESIEVSSYAKTDYSKIAPLVDIVIPGFSHFKAENRRMGFVYLLSAVGGAALFGVSEYMFNNNFASYNEAATSSDASTFFNRSEQWRNISIVGVSVWVASAFISTIHAILAEDIGRN